MKTSKQYYEHLNNFNNVSTNLKHILGTLLMTGLLFTSCNKADSDDLDIIIRATAQDFNQLKADALTDLTQTFPFNIEDGSTSFTSEKGVSITLNPSCLTLNGSPVTGQIDLEFIELFDKGAMLTTNKPTMGFLPNGDKTLLISGGEFHIMATKDGNDLEINCDIQLTIPTNLTGGADNDMTLWNGVIDDDGDLAWDENKRDGAQEGGVFAEGNAYYAFIGDFGWSNVDRFYNDPRDKTTILVRVPEGYDNTNSSVFLSYDGEDTGLANLDTYDANSGLFSEHYGQIPIGLECHVIFVTEDANDWKYAVQAATILENGVITITDAETAVVTQSQLETVINGLP